MIYLGIFKEIFNIPVADLQTSTRCNLKCSYCFVEKLNSRLTIEKLKPLLEQRCFMDYNFFGGEPLLEIDLLLYVLDETNNTEKNSTIITNGTLIPKYIEKLKKYNIHFQISFDGIKEAHDINRVYNNGKGSYYDVLKGIQSCIDNEVSWSLHGVITKKTIPFIAESYEKYFDTMLLDKKFYPITKAIDNMKHNSFQTVFEEEYNDKDIDVYLKELDKIERWVLARSDLKQSERRQLILNIFGNTGGVCGGGTSLLTVDTDLNQVTEENSSIWRN